MASRLSVITAKLKAKIEAVLPAYTVYTEWGTSCLEASDKFVQLMGYYETSANTTEGVARLGFKFDIYLGAGFSATGEDKESIEEEVNVSFETIIALAISPVSQEVVVYKSVNNGNPAQVCDFTIIYK